MSKADGTMAIREIIVPVKTISLLNVREHWAKRAKRSKEHREVSYLMLRSEIGAERPKMPLAVKLTRLSPRQLDDDNLRGALKAVRDGVADYFGVDDRHPGIEWLYGQEKGPYGVKIEIACR